MPYRRLRGRAGELYTEAKDEAIDVSLRAGASSRSRTASPS